MPSRRISSAKLSATACRQDGLRGQVRILRASPLAHVSDVCPEPPCP